MFQLLFHLLTDPINKPHSVPAQQCAQVVILYYTASEQRSLPAISEHNKNPEAIRSLQQNKPLVLFPTSSVTHSNSILVKMGPRAVQVLLPHIKTQQVAKTLYTNIVCNFPQVIKEVGPIPPPPPPKMIKTPGSCNQAKQDKYMFY